MKYSFNQKNGSPEDYSVSQLRAQLIPQSQPYYLQNSNQDTPQQVIYRKKLQEELLREQLGEKILQFQQRRHSNGVQSTSKNLIGKKGAKINLNNSFGIGRIRNQLESFQMDREAEDFGGSTKNLKQNINFNNQVRNNSKGQLELQNSNNTGIQSKKNLQMNLSNQGLIRQSMQNLNKMPQDCVILPIIYSNTQAQPQKKSVLQNNSPVKPIVNFLNQPPPPNLLRGQQQIKQKLNKKKNLNLINNQVLPQNNQYYQPSKNFKDLIYEGQDNMVNGINNPIISKFNSGFEFLSTHESSAQSRNIPSNLQLSQKINRVTNSFNNQSYFNSTKAHTTTNQNIQQTNLQQFNQFQEQQQQQQQQQMIVNQISKEQFELLTKTLNLTNIFDTNAQKLVFVVKKPDEEQNYREKQINESKSFSQVHYKQLGSQQSNRLERNIYLNHKLQNINKIRMQKSLQKEQSKTTMNFKTNESQNVEFVKDQQYGSTREGEKQIQANKDISLIQDNQDPLFSEPIAPSHDFDKYNYELNSSLNKSQNLNSNLQKLLIRRNLNKNNNLQDQNIHTSTFFTKSADSNRRTPQKTNRRIELKAKQKYITSPTTKYKFYQSHFNQSVHEHILAESKDNEISQKQGYMNQTSFNNFNQIQSKRKDNYSPDIMTRNVDIDKNFDQYNQQLHYTPISIREKANKTQIEIRPSDITLGSNSSYMQLSKNQQNNRNMRYFNINQQLSQDKFTKNKAKFSRESRDQLIQKSKLNQSNSPPVKRYQIKNEALVAEPQNINNQQSVKLTLYSSIHSTIPDNVNKTAQNKFIKRIPQSFYNKYRVNKIRETLESQEREKVKNEYEHSGYDCVFEECQCKQIEKSQEQLKCSRSKSPTQKSQRIQQISLHLRQKKVSNILSNPFQACRRCCSTNHNPFKHHLRIIPKVKNIKIRDQNTKSTTKLLIVQTQVIERVPSAKRPCSQDSGMRRKQREMLAIDWAKSKIYNQLKSTHRSSKMSNSFMNEEQNRILDNKFKLEEDDIYTEIETYYHQSILKKSLHANDIVPQEQLSQIFKKAMRTLKKQMHKLLLSKTFESIKETYEQTLDSKQTINNCIKLLLRCKKMYEAEGQVRKILKTVIQREKLKDILEILIEEQQKDQLLRIYEDLVNISAKIYNSVDNLQNEHRNFKRPFIFKKNDYLVQMHSDSEYYRQILEEDYDIYPLKCIDEKGNYIDNNIKPRE